MLYIRNKTNHQVEEKVLDIENNTSIIHDIVNHLEERDRLRGHYKENNYELVDLDNVYWPKF